jgi:hypothetical protein
MLSDAKRPVELIATNEDGVPRWVIANWRDSKPETVLLLNPKFRLSHGWIALCYRPRTGDVLHISADILNEMEPWYTRQKTETGHEKETHSEREMGID